MKRRRPVPAPIGKAAITVYQPDERPAGTVRIWRLNGAGFKLARELPKLVAVADIRAIKRGPRDLLEWTPTAGRGTPIRMAAPAVLDAWGDRPAVIPGRPA